MSFIVSPKTGILRKEGEYILLCLLYGDARCYKKQDHSKKTECLKLNECLSER